MVIVSDTNILSSLASADALDLLAELFHGDTIHIPPAVEQELQVALDYGQTHVERVFQALEAGDIQRIQLTDAERLLMPTLRRENYLRQSVSSMIAVKRRRWKETTANPLQDFKTHIDCDELLRWLERREINFADEQKALANLPYIELVYEKDLLKAEVHQKTMDRLFAYLGVPAMPVKSKLVRISPNKMSDFIENYAEVANVVSQTKYAKFLYG